MMTFSPEWVSQRAAAEYLGVSERTLLRWRQSGLLRPGEHFARKFVAPNSPLVYKLRLCEPPLPGKLTPLHSDHFNHQGA